MGELVLASYIKIMQESFTKCNKQESAARMILDSILSQEAVSCSTDLSSKKISNIVNRKDPVPEDMVVASADGDVVTLVHSYFSERVMKEINPHRKLDALDKMAQLVQQDGIISTMKKEELLSLFDAKEYDVFLADVFLYVIGRNNKTSKELDNRNQKRLLYKSSLTSDKTVELFFYDSNIKMLSATEDIKSNEIYRLDGYFSFDSQYDEDGNRHTDMITRMASNGIGSITESGLLSSHEENKTVVQGII